MSIIETEALSRHYGSRRGIEAVRLSVPEGSLFGFLGPNGAGKTTAIRVMVGLLRPSAGTARIMGLDCWRDSRAIKSDLGYMPGDLRLMPWLDGHRALRIWGLVRGRDLKPYGRELAERFQLDLGVKVRNMSRGMRQKLGLILALAHKPRILILDEPTGTLDPLMQSEVQSLLRQWSAAGHTVFFSSHTLGEVEQLCDRVAMIRQGRLVADESLDGLRKRAGHEVTIRWRSGSSIHCEPPALFDLTKREPTIWHGMYRGPVDELVRWLADKPLDDLSVGRPDLETLFHQYYASESATP